MTIGEFTEELRWHWSWLCEQYLAPFYEQYLARLYAREWAQWELLTIAGFLSIILFVKIRRRRRRMAARIARLASSVPDEPTMVGVRLAGGNGYRRNGEDLQQLAAPAPEPYREHHRWSRGMEIVELSDQPVRQLRREIIKRDQTEARLEREVAELTISNERLQREVAESMRAEERLERKFVELAAANERLQRAAQIEQPVSG